MAIPPYEEFYNPTLKFFNDNQVHTNNEVIENNIKFFSLSEEEINQKTKGGTSYTHEKNSRWAVSDLQRAGLLIKDGKGYKISKRGKHALINYENITKDFLMLFNSYRLFKQPKEKKYTLKIYQIIKRINNTELGMGNTHETYLRLNNNVDGHIIFGSEDQRDFINKRDFKKYSLTYTYGREKRFNGLGDFYRDNNLSAGDEVIVERKLINDKEYFLIDFLHHDNNIILQKFSQGFEILSGDINIIKDKKYNGQNICINFSHSGKKRQDSPTNTDFYKFYLDEHNQLNSYKHNDLIEISLIDNNVSILLIKTCMVHEMEMDL